MCPEGATRGGFSGRTFAGTASPCTLICPVAGAPERNVNHPAARTTHIVATTPRIRRGRIHPSILVQLELPADEFYFETLEEAHFARRCRVAGDEAQNTSVAGAAGIGGIRAVVVGRV